MRPVGDDSVSEFNRRLAMTNNEHLDIDPGMIILGIGYVTSIFVAIGWLATAVI